MCFGVCNLFNSVCLNFINLDVYFPPQIWGVSIYYFSKQPFSPFLFLSFPFGYPIMYILVYLLILWPSWDFFTSFHWCFVLFCFLLLWLNNFNDLPSSLLIFSSACTVCWNPQWISVIVFFDSTIFVCFFIRVYISLLVSSFCSCIIFLIIILIVYPCFPVTH